MGENFISFVLVYCRVSSSSSSSSSSDKIIPLL
jgi:hypothetical protein